MRDMFDKADIELIKKYYNIFHIKMLQLLCYKER